MRTRFTRLRNWLPLSSVRLRLTLWYVAILAVVLVVFGGIVYASQAQAARNEMYNRLRDAGTRVTQAYDPVTGQVPISESPKTKGILVGEKDILLVVDLQGTIMQQVGPVDLADVKLLSASGFNAIKTNGLDITDLIDKLQTENKLAMQNEKPGLSLIPTNLGGVGQLFFTASFPGNPAGVDYIFFSTLVITGDGRPAMLMLGRPEDDQVQLQQLLWTLVLAGLATLLLSAAGGYWLATRAMRPVRAITRTAREIGGSDLHRRLNIDSTDELGELAATFDGMLDRLENAFARQRQFAADASHELRTPLTIVDLEATRALAHAGSEEQQRALSVIRSETGYMTGLVNDLLLLARADAGRIAFKREEVDISDVALEVVERLAPLAQHAGVRLVTGELPELIVSGDSFYLGRMLSNLVENAVKHTACVQGRNRDREVLVETGQGGSAEAWVRVSDTGEGIAPEHLPHLFERFYRVDEARGGDTSLTSGGAGLGLSIVNWVVQAHGGTVRVESEPGAGSMFEVWLPLAACTERQSAREEALVG